MSLNTKLIDIRTLLTALNGYVDGLETGITVKCGYKSSSKSQTRPDNATPYAINDVVGTNPATNIEFENVSSIAGGAIIINHVRMSIAVAAVPSGMSGFRLHLYNAAPTAIADNIAYNLPVADRTKYLGYIDIDKPEDFGATLISDMKDVGFDCELAAASTSLYGVLVAKAVFTPTALCVKTITLGCLEV